MDLDAILGELLAGCDLRSELDRRRTFLKCVEYADLNIDADQYNHFLMLAAEKLGQSKLMREAVSMAVRTTGGEKLHLRFDEAEGVQLIGNAAGLIYLSRLLKNLSLSKSAGEHIALNYGEKPLVGESYPLAAYVEDDEYFENIAELLSVDDEIMDPPVVRREISPNDIAAFYIVDFAPEECGLSTGVVYPVTGWEKFMPGMLVWRKELRPDLARVVILRYVSATGEGRLAVDLDDPEIGFISFDDMKNILKARM